MNKPILCIDFDGVIHSYENGWQNGEIYGRATPGFFRWAAEAIIHFQLVIYSSRSKTSDGISAMREAMDRWFKEAVEEGEISPDHGHLEDFFTYSDVKPPAFLTIDDRAICFQGNWQALDPAELTQFRTWTQIDRTTPEGRFVDDWNRMVGTISDLASRYDLPKPQMVFDVKWLRCMNEIADVRLSGTIIYMGVRIRFGRFEHAEILLP